LRGTVSVLLGAVRSAFTVYARVVTGVALPWAFSRVIRAACVPTR
jgi:hypothetical protein